MKTFKLAILFVLYFASVSAQSYTGVQKNQGYAMFGDKVTFIFDETVYDVTPDKVVVTGMFSGWSQDMDDSEWQLKKTGEVWLLTKDNTDFAVIKPNTTFKFRINEGAWQDPPTESKNRKGNDLVFMQDFISPGLKAEIKGDDLIWAKVTGERPLNADAYRIVDAHGKVTQVAGVLPNEGETLLISPAEKLDKRRVYYLEIPSKNLRALCRFDGWFRDTYSTKELGANIHNDSTTVRVFAPRAEMVKLYLYKHQNDKDAYRIEEMAVDAQGVWESIIPQDLHGIYYDFTVHGANDPGNNFYSTHPVHITDPYARVSDDTWGKARIWKKTTPASPLKNGIPKLEDVIAYEVHIQDFTDRLPIDEKLKGTFNGMITPGLKNKNGRKIGFDYLLDLGINVVHLMPVQEYLHWPNDDWSASFKDDPYMIEQGVNEENYQWGYRTSHAMAVESRYRVKGDEPGAEREQFRDLVQAFHDEDIAVIIDIVPNHTAENMDGNSWLFNFNGFDMQYYYRTKDLEHIGEYGNEVKTENRPMVQRWIIDQCRHFVEEFGIDGFRIDLAGQIDKQTLKALKAALGPDIIVYGEAWIGSNDPEFEDNPDWDWYKEDSPITFFQDDSRNAYKGPVFELKDYRKDRGWPGGKFDERQNVMKGLSARFPDDKTPLSGISYLDIHDNFALADQFGGKNFDGRYGVDQDEYKIAVTLLYTTLGPIVTHGGSEIMRSKAHAPLKEVVKMTKNGFNVYMHGYRDTYNHRTANQFIWEQVGQKPNEKNSNDYANMHAFWKGMNAFRLSKFGEVFRKADPVSDDYYKWILPENEGLLGYIVDNKIIVLLNATGESQKMEILVPGGSWKLIGTTEEIDHQNGVKVKGLKSLKVGNRSIEMDPTSLLIWVNEIQN